MRLLSYAAAFLMTVGTASASCLDKHRFYTVSFGDVRDCVIVTTMNGKVFPSSCGEININRGNIDVDRFTFSGNVVVEFTGRVPAFASVGVRGVIGGRHVVGFLMNGRRVITSIEGTYGIAPRCDRPQ